jgi:endonuclease/exonuclease/phosphatase family metal-dependent hydrolase
VVTLNVRNARALDGAHAWPLRRSTTAAALRQLDADVIGLQEAYRCQERYLHRRLDGFATYGRGRGRRDRGERCPVLHRATRLERVRAEVRWFSDEPSAPGSRLPGAFFPRLATLVELADPSSGRRFGVACTHLDERHGANRVRSAELLVTWLRPEIPWVVMGDLNARPDTAPLRVLAAAGLRPVLSGDVGTTTHGFTGRSAGRPIDHILVRGEWEVLGAAVDRRRPGGRLPSDHWPVVADLALGE